jgi:hypothetical protein
MRSDPLTIILIGCLISSIGFNILVSHRNYELEQKKNKPIIIILEKESCLDANLVLIKKGPVTVSIGYKLL